MRDIGAPEIALIVLAIVLIFGVGKLGDIGGAIGKSVREFRIEKDRKDDDVAQPVTPGLGSEAPFNSSESLSAGTHVCRNCGKYAPEKASFCMGCGTRL